jgi:hypothetical protein
LSQWGPQDTRFGADMFLLACEGGLPLHASRAYFLAPDFLLAETFLGALGSLVFFQPSWVDLSGFSSTFTSPDLGALAASQQNFTVPHGAFHCLSTPLPSDLIFDDLGGPTLGALVDWEGFILFSLSELAFVSAPTAPFSESDLFFLTHGFGGGACLGLDFDVFFGGSSGRNLPCYRAPQLSFFSSIFGLTKDLASSLWGAEIASLASSSSWFFPLLPFFSGIPQALTPLFSTVSSGVYLQGFDVSRPLRTSLPAYDPLGFLSAVAGVDFSP